MSIKTKRLIGLKAVLALTSLSRSEIARREAVGTFPSRVRLSPHPRGRVAFVEEEVHDWLCDRLTERTSD